MGPPVYKYILSMYKENPMAYSGKWVPKNI